MSSRDDLRALLREAAAETAPENPAWNDALRLARRKMRFRAAAAGLATVALLAGGLTARAAIDDDGEQSDRETGGRNLPDLVVEVSGNEITVRNRGRGTAVPVVLSLKEENGVRSTLRVPRLEPGDARTRTVDCTTRLTAVVDPADRVEESSESNNRARCRDRTAEGPTLPEGPTPPAGPTPPKGPTPPTGPTPPKGPSPPEGATTLF
jgi:hypothetical protein